MDAFFEQFQRECHHCIGSNSSVTLSAGGDSPSECYRSPRAPTAMHRERKSYSTYIMGSLTGTLYIGVTSNLPKRVFEHKFHRIAGFTDKYDVEPLLYGESFDDVQKAICREKQLKGWRRSKKIALIEFQNPQWLDLAREWFPWMKVQSFFALCV